jgi:hypothetical protein
MKKLFFLFIISFLFSCENEVSDLQSEYYIKFYGSYLEDEGYDLKPTPDGGLIITGYMSSEETGKDVVLIKVDKFGNEATWSPQIFGSSSDDVAYSVKVLDDGYIIAGSTRGDNNNDLDAYLIRTDLSGNMIWENTYETSINQYDNESFSVEITDDGGFIFVGYTKDSNQAQKVSIFITDDKGNTTKQSTRGEVNEQLSVIHKLNDGSFVVLGTKLNENSDYFFLRINKDGNDFYNASFGESNRDDVLNCACLGEDNSLLMAGTSASGSSTGILLIKYMLDTDEISWQKFIREGGNFEGKAVTEMENGNILLVGNKTVAENKKIILYFISPGGEVLSSKEYGSSGNQSAEALIYQNEQIIILGKNEFEGNSMISLIKTDKEGNVWE